MSAHPKKEAVSKRGASKKVRNRASIVVLALDQSLGELRVADGETVGIDLWPSASDAIRTIQNLDIPVLVYLAGAHSKDSIASLQSCLPSIKIVTQGRQGLEHLLERLRKRRSAQKGKPIFSSADRVLRGLARRKRYLTAPHPLAAAILARGGSLHFAQIKGPRSTLLKLDDAVPYRFEPSSDDEWQMLATLSDAAVADAIRSKLAIRVLLLDPGNEDPVLIRLRGSDNDAPAKLAQRKILSSTQDRVLIALNPRERTSDLGVHAEHGYVEFLTPSPELVEPAPQPDAAYRDTQYLVARWPLDRLEISRQLVELPPRAWLCPGTAASFQSDVDRYCGADDLDSAGPIVSRHIDHADNERTVNALLKDLRDIGYCAYRHRFQHDGRTLDNVVADLPGLGYLRINPDILEKLRQLLRKYPFPRPLDPWIRQLKRIVGASWFRNEHLDELTAVELRRIVEAIFCLRPWYPWWRKLCNLPGIGAKIIIVGCHLDSTANRDLNYDSANDPAPGADDNASGIAATLAIARQLWGLRGSLRHTIRFCFFNAEEAGLVGSKAYAAKLKCLRVPLKAVLCTDMMGYNSDAQRIFEIHAGYTDPTIRDLSEPIARTIEAWAASLGTLAPAQVYRGTNPSGGADRDVYDGGINRSDHAAFHQQGYPAVLVSEDFFANLASESAADPNPNYHRASDTSVDAAFGADITCAVAQAVKELAS